MNSILPYVIDINIRNGSRPPVASINGILSSLHFIVLSPMTG